jgi:hypothetical protein
MPRVYPGPEEGIRGLNAAKVAFADVVVCEFGGGATLKSRHVVASGNCVVTAVRRLKSAPCAVPFFGPKL